MLDPLMIWLTSISPWLTLAFSVSLLLSLVSTIVWAWSTKGLLAIIIRIITLPIAVIGIALGISGAFALLTDIRDWISGNR